ncbi:hypothetical protein [Streptomyces hawaiiensis]|uniref:hypothetical protein n=1 Tax=Streptomyces hawaiiensis TaxID=67305 RepID=UPI00319E2AA2
MDQGVSSREACRIVGINRRTAKRWRNGRTDTKKRPAQSANRMRAERVPSASRHLTLEERLYIADQVWAKVPVRRIAADMGPQSVHDQPEDTPQPPPRQRPVTVRVRSRAGKRAKRGRHPAADSPGRLGRDGLSSPTVILRSMPRTTRRQASDR